MERNSLTEMKYTHNEPRQPPRQAPRQQRSASSRPLLSALGRRTLSSSSAEWIKLRNRVKMRRLLQLVAMVDGGKLDHLQGKRAGSPTLYVFVTTASISRPPMKPF